MGDSLVAVIISNFYSISESRDFVIHERTSLTDPYNLSLTQHNYMYFDLRISLFTNN